MADTLTLYKLIVLKMLDEADAPLTGAQITDFILEKEYTNYFTLQQVLSEMSETGLVTVASTRNSSLYRITDSGRHTLKYFGDKVSDTICGEITSFLQEHQIEIRNALSEYRRLFSIQRRRLSGTLSGTGTQFHTDRSDTFRSF